MTVGAKIEVVNNDGEQRQRGKRCVHFRGAQHNRCAAGVYMLSVRDVSGPRPYRWPCFTFVGAPACASFRAETQEERDAGRAEALAAAEEYYRKLIRHQCPTCDAAIRDLQQVGSCVYTEPCGHRVGQGDAAVMKAAIADGTLGLGGS